MMDHGASNQHEWQRFPQEPPMPLWERVSLAVAIVVGGFILLGLYAYEEFTSWSKR